MTQGVDQLLRALVALAAFTDAAMDDLLEMIATGQPRHVARAEARAGVASHQHAEELPDLIDVVARLPLGSDAGQDVARRGHRVHRPSGDAAMVALLAHQ